MTNAAVEAEKQRQKSDDERRKWDDYYRSLPALTIDNAMRSFGEDLAARVGELLPHGGRVLEAGCGGGWQSLVLAESGNLDVALMDFSSEALRYAKQTFVDHGVRADFICQDVFAPGEAAYDMVFNAGVLEHYTFDEQVAFLRGMAARSQRYVLALVPNRMCYWYWMWRMQHSARANWPFGKEMPMADLSAAFEAAGLNFLGHWFGGENWTDFFIKDLVGIDDGLRQEILSIQNSNVIPRQQRCYLVAGLGCKGHPTMVPSCWSSLEGNEDFTIDQITASLADALAVSVAADHRRQQAENALYETRQQLGSQVETLSAQAANWERDWNEAHAALEGCQFQLDAIVGSRAWRLIENFRKVRLSLAPHGSRREAAVKLALRAGRGAASPRTTARRLARRLIGYLPLAWQYRIRAALTPSPAEMPSVEPVFDPRVEVADVPGLVSVVLPVYNHAAMLRGAVESVLAQTYRNLELIIVNDGSSDGVEEVLAEYVGNPRVRILTQKNQKLPKALSNGFEFARGEFWTWTSADNLMHPDQLLRQVEYLQTHDDAGLVFADYTAIDGEGKPLEDPTFRPHNRRTPRDPVIHLPRDTRGFGENGDNYLGPCFLYRSRMGRLLGEYDPTLGIEDFDYWLRLSLVGRLAHLGSDESLYQYRVHDNSLSGRAAELKIHEHARRLMGYHLARKEFHAKPWTIYADAATQEWLGKMDVGENQIVPWSGEAINGDEAEKCMLLVQADSLSAAVASRRSSAVCLIAWFPDDADAPERYRAESRGAADLCFAADDATANRLTLLTSRVFRAAPGPQLFDLATKWANGRAFYESTRPEVQRARSLPQVFRPASQKIRVLLQADSFTQGGMEQVVLDVANCLREEKFDVSLLILGEQGHDAERARQAGLQVLTLPLQNRESHYRRLLKDRKIDVVNAHYSLFGAPIAAEAGVPFVQTVHNTYIFLPPDGVAGYRANDEFTSAYLCVSQMAAHYSDIRLGLPVSKMMLVPNGIDLAKFDASAGRDARRALRAELGLSAENYVFLNVGSLHGVKCQAILVNAFADVVREFPEARLILLGRAMDAKYTTHVKRAIARHRLEDSVILAGHRTDAARFYRASDAFVLPSLCEGWSLALAEAVAAGLPAIASAVGSAPDVLPKIGGRLIQPPFGAITNLDYFNLGKYVVHEDPRFIADIAAALKEQCRERSRPLISEEFRRSLDCREAYRPYGQVFLWLLQGGHPSAARPWTTGRLACRESSKAERAAA